MEDLNIIAADCVVICCCCCQCLILQVVAFILLKLPHRVIRRTRDMARKKFIRKRKRRGKTVRRKIDQYEDEFMELGAGPSIKAQLADGLFADKGIGSECCMEEVEKVLVELSRRGEFAFGSFWGRAEPGAFPNCSPNREFDGSVVYYQFIQYETVSSLSCS